MGYGLESKLEGQARVKKIHVKQLATAAQVHVKDDGLQWS
jgi:hypothetical protein